MIRIDASVLAALPLEHIDRVTFYKRDEITSDLICCEIVVPGKVWTFHEELTGWKLLINYLSRLPGFQADWHTAVTQAPFAPNETLAFSRSQPAH
ncbi:hypothetical protein [Novosphingobium sp.]|uniref:hypothetical protein n=1 Tax=Novosphingobium sp. TaxID=1874826 RepID=UPI0027370917|nr:hypothetical protein [Novosphingobium sp.]MDP3907063.1 hypothetical protein [Novosphingobium sp.]